MDDGIALPPQRRTIADDARPSSQIGDLSGTPQTPVDWRELIQGSGTPNVFVQIQEEPDGTISAVSDDGSVTIGMPAVHTRREREPDSFVSNLAEKIDMGAIVEEVIQGVDADIVSRSDWTQQYAKALDLLGIRIEDIPRGTSASKEYSKAS